MNKKIIAKIDSILKKSKRLQDWRAFVTLEIYDGKIVKLTPRLKPHTPSSRGLAPVFTVELTEHERGWGQRSDGKRTFPNKGLAQAFVKRVNARNNLKTVPDIYVTASIV